MKVTILVDNLKSWALPHAEKLCSQLKKKYPTSLVHDQKKIKAGEVAIFLSCEKLVKPEVLKKNKHNLVAHASDLPRGKGWSPMTWQILEGKNKIPISLFEAVDKVDAGEIYEKATIKFEGHELIGEMQKVLGEKINEMILCFLDRYPNIRGVKQTGKESFYSRRRPENSVLSPNKTIAEQFNLLRVVDNKKYPAFFNYRGHKYILKIYKDK